MSLRTWLVNGRPIATTYSLDGSSFHPTLKHRVGSAFCWVGMRLLLGKPPKNAALTRRDGKVVRLAWWRS